MTSYNYNIKLETCPYLYDSNGMRLLDDELSNGISVSPVIKINQKFVEGTSLSLSCDGRKRTKGYHEIYFTSYIWKYFFKGIDGYDYLMTDIDDYTFHRWGETPCLVLKGFIGVDTMGKKYIDLKECYIMDISFYNSKNYYDNKIHDISSLQIRSNKNEEYGVYYDYTKFFNLQIQSKL